MANKTTKKPKFDNKKKNEKVNKPAGEKILIYKQGMKVQDVAEGLGISNAVVIKQLMQLGVMASVNVDLDRDTIELITSVITSSWTSNPR